VVLVVLVSEKSHAAFIALENLKDLMTSFVNELVSFRDKSLRAIVTLEILFTCMNLLVVHQAIFELKFLSANLIGTLITRIVTQKF